MGFSDKDEVVIEVEHTFTDDRRGPLRWIGNVVWIFFGGLWLTFFWFLLGILLCLPIVTIPCAKQCFKMGCFVLLPFGKRVQKKKRGAAGCLFSIAGNILWIPFGLVFCLLHFVFAILCCCTIIGIPFAWQHLKIAQLSLTPFGLEVSADETHSEKTVLVSSKGHGAGSYV